ncbi:unnamed protein product, partial [Rotaria sordida]
TITDEPMIPSTIDIQKSSGDFLTNKTVEEKIKIDKISPVTTDITPSTDIKGTKIQHPLTHSKKTKKSKEKKPKTEKKSGVLSTFFQHNKQKSKVPALDLPPVERDLSSNTQLCPTYQSDNNPLHIPSTNLPKLDIPLPTYDRPEVNMTTGKIKQTSEFAVPIIDLTPIPNLNVTEDNKQLIDTTSDHMKIPNVQLPNLQFTNDDEQKINKLSHTEIQTKVEEIPKLPTIENDQKNLPIQTETIIPKLSSFDKTEISIKPELSPIEQKITINETNIDQLSKPSVTIENKTSPNFNFQLPPTEPVSISSKTSASSPPSFDDNVPSQIISTRKPSEKQLIETKSEPRKKSSILSLCSCFSNKSTNSKDKIPSIQAPKTNLPEVNIPPSSSNISSTLKTQGSLRAPSNNLPQLDLTSTSVEPVTVPTIHIQDKKQEEIQAPRVEKQLGEEKIKVQTDIPTVPIETQKVKDIRNVSTESKKSSSFDIKAPVLNIPELNLSDSSKTDAYLSFTKQQDSTSIPEQIQSRSDSGLEAIISSHMHPSSTFGTITTMEDIQQHPSISSGLGSEILDKTTIHSSTLYDIQIIQSKEDINLTNYDNLTYKITMNDDIRSKLIFRQDDLKKCLENEIAKSIHDFNPKKDHKPLEKILIHAIDLIKDNKVTTYSELQQILTMEHKNDAFIVNPVVRSLYCTIEKQGLDNIDKPEFPLAIRDMVRLPAKQTFDTVTHSNKEEMPLATTQMTNETRSLIPDVSIPSETPITIEKKSSKQTTKSIDNKTGSCLTCGRSKSKTKIPSSSSSSTTTTSSNGLLDERRRLQLNTHRHELGTILHEHIQSSKPSIRKFNEHSKEIEKIIRRSLVLVTHPKIQSYEQIRNDLKTEYKQIFYLIDPIIDIIRDTFNSCDITQMHEKINLDILNSNISQTANLYNNQMSLLTIEEYNILKSNKLLWLQEYLINNEIKEKKLTRKQIKELNKILQRSLEILSTNTISTWDELLLQLQREYLKAHDLCNRSIELLKQSHRDGLFLLSQAPNEEKRRSSFLLSERARQNLKNHRSKINLSLKNLLINHNKLSNDDDDNKQLDIYINKTLTYLDEQKPGQFKNYNDLKQQLKQDFKNNNKNQDYLIEQIVDVIEQAHAINQFDDIDKPDVQTLMKDRLDGKPLIIKEMYVSLPPRIGISKSANDESSRYLLTSINGDRTLNNTTSSHSIARGLSWREANERARILFYRGKHPAIHYDEQADAFDVRMLLETASGGTQEIPVTDTDVHELLNSCGVQWDGVNIISLVDHSEDVVRAAEQAALKVIREKGIIDLRTPPSSSTTNVDIHDESVVSPDATASSS